LDEETFEVKIVMAEAPHGTAPTLFRKDIANPIAMILACSALLTYIQHPRAQLASRVIYQSVFDAVHSGHTTTDLGGSLTTTEFTEQVVQRIQVKLRQQNRPGK
jgi:isocitrate dehydrogenase (NAD+)